MKTLQKKLFLFLFLLCPILLHADATPDIKVAVVSEQAQIRPGTTFWTAVSFSLPPEWHLYWLNPGSNGAPPKVSVTAPPGWVVGDILFPAPSRLEAFGSIFYGYSNECVLLLSITPPSTLKIGESASLTFDIAWIACGTSCVPGKATATLDLKVHTAALENSSAKALFADARLRLPQIRSQLVVETKGAITEIQIPSQNGPFQNVSGVTFFPEKQGTFDPTFRPKWRLSKSGRRLVVELPTKLQQDAAGVVRFSYVKAGEIKNVAIQVPRKPPEGQRVVDKMRQMYEQQLSTIQGLFTLEFASILLLAFLGGIVLNIMPCVLPVVSLKVLHFIKMAGQGRRTTFKHGALFSLGIISCFWLLAGATFVLQSFGKTVGWGFQLQEPLFVACLIILLFILSLSLFGLFEFGTKIASIAAELDEVAKAGSPAQLDLPSSLSSFFSGVLATFVASPCTGPLLGTAIGFTATLSPLYAFFVFTSLGVGMAFPYLLLSLFPTLLKVIPRPGRWMVTFKQLMGFFMLATVLWLVWVLAAETQNISMISLFSSFFFIAFGLWIYGTWGGFDRKSTTRALAKFFALVVVVFGISTLLVEVYASRSRPSDKLQEKLTSDLPRGTEWEPFSLARLDQLQQKGVPVFVEFSAKWCLICRANALVLDSKSVKEAFVKYGVVKMYADWTQMDDEITQVIRSLGRNGVPVHALYSGEQGSAPELFPELVTQDMIINALKATQESQASPQK